MNTNRTPALAPTMRACTCGATFAPRAGAVCCDTCEAGKRAAWTPAMPTGTHTSN